MITTGTSAGMAGAGVRSPSLPVELTTFIGRAAELAELERLLGDGRLLTLTGAGGSGKTRLALELVDRCGGGVAWVELAGLDDPALIPQHVAEAFGVRDEVSGTDGLMALLRARGGLLVLDNCEHLVDACAELAHALLRGCPELRILATSREALGVKGERAWLVPPLSMPASVDLGPDEAAAFEAVRLFVDRARDSVPDFALTPGNTAAVVDICRRLDGIPLAIELAAARVRVLPPEQIRARLDHAFQLLTSGGRTAVPRHRTLRAAIDWSHDLLRDASKVLLRRQAVFRGGYTLDAAEAVCAGDGLDPSDVLELVAQLVDRSLLVVREHQGAARFGPLETVRQYALERLVESGEEEAIRRRHAAYVMGLVEAAATQANKAGRRAAFDALLPEMDNIREALLWTREHEPRAHVHLTGKLGWFWFAIGHWTEALRWVEEALALPEAGDTGSTRAQLLFAGGAMASLQAAVQVARPWLEESVALAEAAGDDELAAYASNYLGMTYVGQGRPEGAEYCARAEAWFRRNGDDYGLRLALLLLGMGAQFAGRPGEAIERTEEAVAVARRFGQDRELSIALQNLGTLHIMQGQIALAEPLLMEALTAARRDPLYLFVATTLDGLGEVRVHQARVREAGRILGAAEALRRTLGAGQFEINRRRLVPLLEAVRTGPDAPDFEAGWSEGLALAMEPILAEVLDAGGATPPAAPALPAGRVVTPTPVRAGSGSRVEATREAEPADLWVAALGPLEVIRRGEPLGADAWAYAKPRELLVFLLLHPSGRAREQIGQAIWPGSSAAQAKNSFHVTLHHLRKTLGGAEWVVIQDDRYRISPALRCELDADLFEAEARAALADPEADAPRLAAILGRYRGDLLDGDVTGPWVDEHRDRLRRLRVELGLALGAALEALGNPAAAAEAYHAVAVREELNEEAQRRLMRAWAITGDRARAIRHYERLVALLRDELDAEPEPETAQLFERLRLPVTA